MRRILISTLVAATAFGLVGCSSAGYNMPTVDMGAPAPATMPGGGDAYREAIGETAYGADGDVARPGGQQVITHGSLSVTVADPVGTADEVTRIVAAAGGHVESRNEYVGTPGNPGRADLTLRIPSNRLDAVLTSLKELGEARDTTISSTDVTQQSQDISARITALETSVDRLLALLERADDTDTLITIERELSQRQAELEGLKAQKRYLDDQVAMSTIAVYLVAERDAPIDEPDNFWTGLQTGWDAFVAFWAGMLVALGVLAPWLVLIGLIVLGVVLIVKRASRGSSAPKTE
ncbi:MAG: DUF4349 domain-containing protein [Cryobacterium sp.]|nr:DUF4349 domain-containing protein [Cryobacterium sp.]